MLTRLDSIKVISGKSQSPEILLRKAIALLYHSIILSLYHSIILNRRFSHDWLEPGKHQRFAIPPQFR